LIILKNGLSKFSAEQAIPKIKHFCAYQERCHTGVRDKLYSFGLHRKDVDRIVADLQEGTTLMKSGLQSILQGANSG
jgi:hypothetical protein